MNQNGIEGFVPVMYRKDIDMRGRRGKGGRKSSFALHHDDGNSNGEAYDEDEYNHGSGN